MKIRQDKNLKNTGSYLDGLAIFCAGAALAFTLGAFAAPRHLTMPLLNMASVVLGLFATLYIASGVKLSRQEIKFFCEDVEAKNRHIRELGNALAKGSSKLNLGVTYACVAAYFALLSQITPLIWPV